METPPEEQSVTQYQRATEPLRTVAADPVVAAQEVGIQPVNAPYFGDSSTPDSQGQWSSGLFSCFNHCGVCCATFFCPSVILSQLVNQVWSRSLTCAGIAFCAFTFVLCAFLPLAIYYYAIYQAIEENAIGDYAKASYWVTFYNNTNSVATAINFVMGMLFLVVIMEIRSHIRRRDHITPYVLHRAEPHPCCTLLPL